MSETLNLCGLTIERGSKLRTYLPVPDTATKLPLTIINGREDGPTLLVTAGIHGGEYPGIAATMELGKALTPEEIKGCLIILHVVNPQGFWERREFIVPEDGKNLNRVFPGKPDGTLSEKTAYLLSSSFFPIADFYVDLHSGDILESLHPYAHYPGQPTAEIEQKSRAVAKVLDMEYIVRSLATGGAYNYAASAGLPSILIERGCMGLCLNDDVEAYKQDLLNVLSKLEMYSAPVKPRRHQPRDMENVIYLEAPEACCWRHCAHCGDFVREGQVLGYTTDIFGEPLATYHAQQTGVVLYVCPALATPKGTVLIAYGTVKEDAE